MKFFTRRRRQAPAIIIVSLIDILMVLLIFLIATTTFKQHPALKLALPESRQGKAGASESSLVVTIASKEPYLYLGEKPVTADKLLSEMVAAAARNPEVQLALRADSDAPFGQIVKVMDAAKTAKIKNVSALTKSGGN